MGQRPKVLTPKKSPLHYWGWMLRELRNGRGFSLRGLSEKTFISHSQLAKLEQAERVPRLADAEVLDAALDARHLLIELWERIGKDDVSERPHVSSSAVHVSKPSFDLATALSGQATSDDEGISVPCRLRDGQVVFVSLDRRALLRSGVGLGAGAAFGVGTPAVADPGAVAGLVRRARAASTYGSTPLEHLRKTRRRLIDSDNLVGPRQVLRTARAHIEVIQTLRREASGSDSRDLMELQTQFAEFTSWLYQDLGNNERAQYWLDRALTWSHGAADNELTTYVMARKAQLAGDTRDLADVVDLAEAAQRMARPRSRLAAVGQTYASYGHALRGESSASARSIDQVHNALDSVASDPSPWGVWLNESYVEVHRAQGLEVMSKHADAADAFAAAIRSLPDDYHRDRGVYLAREAVAHAGAGAPEQAAAVGLDALAIAEDTGSGRIVNELARLDTGLAVWSQLPEVTDFRSSFNAVLVHETEMGA
ncbi:helix-turn-helix domain-containing protein [Streptomyces sp. NPDC088729]|uniref:helix-turn-helix domain-containing protein n=1 Tax=Streptomyces sp. NPDC088729 TaxID=3365876 RepID=UPI00380120D5